MMNMEWPLLGRKADIPKIASAKTTAFDGLGHVPPALWMSAVRSVTAYHRRPTPCARIKHLVTVSVAVPHAFVIVLSHHRGWCIWPTQFAALILTSRRVCSCR